MFLLLLNILAGGDSEGEQGELTSEDVGDSGLGVGGDTEVDSLRTEVGEEGGVTWSCS